MKIRKSYILRVIFRIIITFLLFAVPFGSTFIPAGPRAITITIYLAVVIFEIVRAIRITKMDKRIISVDDIKPSDLKKEFIREIEFSLIAGLITLFIFFDFEMQFFYSSAISNVTVVAILLTWFAAIAVIAITPLVLLSRTFGSYVAKNTNNNVKDLVKKFAIKFMRLIHSIISFWKMILSWIKDKLVELNNFLKEFARKTVTISARTCSLRNTILITSKKKATLPPLFNF